MGTKINLFAELLSGQVLRECEAGCEPVTRQDAVFAGSIYTGGQPHSQAMNRREHVDLDLGGPEPSPEAKPEWW